jgi:putative PIN family toxin of toxin-antitoxin system
MYRIVIDTSVFISALISRNGASFLLISLIDKDLFQFALSVALVLEYEATAKRLSGSKIRLTPQEIDDVIDYLCHVGERTELNYLWRPALRDPNDDMVLELAANASCDMIVTFNVSDFEGSADFGVQVVTPQTFLKRIGVLL